MHAYERALAAYFAYAAAAAWVLPVRQPIPLITLGVNIAIITGLVLIAYAHGLRGEARLGVVRDWFPFPLLLLTYREMGWFAQPHLGHALESRWVEWDRAVLNGGLRAVVECLGAFGPALLECCYLLVYELGMIAVALLYLMRRRDRIATLLFPFALAVVLCYVQFPFWPSEPPRTVFPGQDLPTYLTAVRRLNLGLLVGYGIHTSVFPSAHVAGAFSLAFGMRMALPERRAVWRVFLLVAILIATATVYGRYHYLADAAAGLAMAIIAYIIARLTSGGSSLRWSPTPPPAHHFSSQD